MQVITLSGKVCGPCELRTNKHGVNFIRFKVYCINGGVENYKYTIYRCYCNNTAFSDLQNGDTVFLTGDMSVILTKDENGKEWVNINVHVNTIERG